MKPKNMTERSSNGKRGRKPPLGARSPLGIAAWRASTAALISKSAVPKARTSAADTRANAVPVFLIEDNRLLRDGLTAMLGAQGLKVIATARSGGEALRQVARLKPQLVLLDSALGDRDSLRLVEAVKKVSPDIKVIVMHLLPVHEDVVAFVRAGVSGFIMKDASVAEFVGTIRSVADGASVLPPLMAGTLFSHVAAQALTRGKRGLKAATRMTAREREVTALIAEGLGNKEIGLRLSIAAHTVKSHVHNILEKLALHTRLEVAAYAHANEGRQTTP
ncbi:MAG: response regulator transcription factor [Gemmatimonadales bacterium]|nr:response regulator transcription factor [Gemmatimonadales bacterium]